MSVNKKLFELGNDMVRLHQIITTHFPRPGDPDFDGVPFREIFDEMLRIINIIRMEVPENEKKRRHYDFKVTDCPENLLDHFVGQLEDSGLKVEVCDSKTES